MGGFYNPAGGSPRSGAFDIGSFKANTTPGGGGAGSNQYFNNSPFLANPFAGTSPGGGGATPNPFQVPGTGPLQYPWGSSDPTHAGGSGIPGSAKNLGHGIIATGLQYPGLSQDFVNYLMQNIGAGVTPFNLQTMLPGGGQTQPGQLTAGLNPLAQQLLQFFQGGGGSGVPGLGALGQIAGGQFAGLPGGGTLQTIANSGISALPEWTGMVNAQQQNIQQNLANLKEQFAGTGNLAGSPFGTATSNYLSQTTADQNALLGQLQQQNILQGQIPAAQGLLGMTQAGAGTLFGGEQQFASGLQSLNQEAIQNQLQEFIRTSSQNNPLLQDIMGLSTLYPPTTKTPTGFDQFTSLLSSLSGAGFSSGGPSGTSVQF